MTGACIVCNSPNRLEIDREIVAGKNKAELCKRYGVSEASIYAHAQDHLSRQLVTALEKKNLAENLDLLNRIDGILLKAELIFSRNFDARKDGLALKALAEQRSTIELLAKISAFMHQNRAMELQAKEQSQQMEEKTYDRKQLAVLTLPELRMLKAINEKIRNQDSDMVIIPEEPERPLPKSHVADPTPDPVAEDSRDIIGGDEDILPRYAVKPIEPIQIPKV